MNCCRSLSSAHFHINVCIVFIWFAILSSNSYVMYSCIQSLLKELTYLPICIITLTACLSLLLLSLIIGRNISEYKIWNAICFFQLGIIILASILYLINDNEDNERNKNILAFSVIALLGEISNGTLSYIKSFIPHISKLELNSISVDIPSTEGQIGEGIRECSICIQSIEDNGCELIRCKHPFHKECITKWIHNYSRSCPMCRNEF